MNTSDFIFTQNTTEVAQIGKQDLYDNYKQLYIDIEWWMYVIFFIALPILGGFGNVSTFIVMRRGSLKEVSTCFYMSILALADTGVLWTGYFTAWITYVTRGKINPYGWTDCKLVYFCWYFFRQYSSALLVMMSIEKCIALYFPFKTKNVCTVKTAKWATGIAAAVYVTINSFFFFVVKQRSSDAGARYIICVYEEFYVKYASLYGKIDGILYSFGPLAIMGITNIALIYTFIKAKLASKRGGTESTNQALSNAAMRGTAILITVTMTFVLLTGPANIISAVTFYAHPLLQPFLYVSVALNHSINGLLYTIVGSKFRKELIDMFRCFRKQNEANVDRKSTHRSNVSNNTETNISLKAV